MSSERYDKMKKICDETDRMIAMWNKAPMKEKIKIVEDEHEN